MLIMVVLIGETGGTTMKTKLANTGPTGWYQHQIPWSTTGTTSPTEKLKAEDFDYPHELWIRSMWVTAERVREETHLRAMTSAR